MALHELAELAVHDAAIAEVERVWRPHQAERTRGREPGGDALTVPERVAGSAAVGM